MNKKDIYYNMLNSCKRKRHILWKLKHHDFDQLIKQNKKLHNIHKGQRCFVIGNGPSLKEQDLSLLADEYVFTVNQIVRKKDFEKIKTNFHFWADPMFFNLNPNNEGDRKLLEVFKGINTPGNTPICFLPITAYDFYKRFELDKDLNVQFYNNSLYLTDNYKREFDFSECIPGFQTVVQYAIAMAIYMGFSEIYLLGCDTTGIISTINSYLDMDNNNYAYEVDTVERNRIKKMSDTRSFEENFRGWAIILHIYSILNRYCADRDIKLMNCSAQTIIDSIPRVKYEDIINAK